MVSLFLGLFVYVVREIYFFLLVESRIIKLLENRISAINFAIEQASDFKLTIKMSMIYHYQMDFREQAITKKRL